MLNTITTPTAGWVRIAPGVSHLRDRDDIHHPLTNDSRIWLDESLVGFRATIPKEVPALASPVDLVEV